MELILILLKDIPFNYSLVNFLLKSNKEVRMNKGVFVNVIVSKVGKDKDVLLDLVDVESLILNFKGFFRTLQVPF